LIYLYISNERKSEDDSMNRHIPRWGLGVDQSDDIGPGLISAEVYTSAEQWQKERTFVFRNTWLLVDSSDVIPNTSDYFVWERMGQSVVITRGEDKSLSAFHNVCQHRGARLVTQSGHCSDQKFVCPFHGFTYDLAGKAVLIPKSETFSAEDVESLRIPEVLVREWNGFIWLHFSPSTAEPLEKYLGELVPEIGWYQLDNWKCYGGNTWEVKANWKVVLEGFLESWHTPFAHRNTVRGGFVTEQTSFSFFGLHSMMVVPLKRIEIDVAPEPLEHRSVADCHYLVFPNTFFNMFPDSGSLTVIYPDNENSCILQTWVIGRPEAPAGQSYEDFDAGLVNSLTLMSRIINEDMWLSEEIGRVRDSFGYTRNILNTKESRITAFQTQLADFIERRMN